MVTKTSGGYGGGNGLKVKPNSNRPSGVPLIGYQPKKYSMDYNKYEKSIDSGVDLFE